MAQIDPNGLSDRELNSWLEATIVPRPIAWTASLNEDGTANLAPFSFFTGVGHDPPSCLISVSKSVREGVTRVKDTRRNIERTGEFIIHVVPEPFGQQMMDTARGYDYGTDEFEVAGLEKTPGTRVHVPRIAGAPVAMECRLLELFEVGRTGTAIIVGEILLWHISDEVLSEGRVDFTKLAAVGRLGGPFYVRTHDTFEIKRRGT